MIEGPAPSALAAASCYATLRARFWWREDVADKQDEEFDREPSADLYRVVAVVVVVMGHWLLSAVTFHDGRFGYDEVLAELPYTQWLTWLFQVVPVFFVVGGYANAGSWMRQQALDGVSRGDWIRRRVSGLLGPVTAYVVVVVGVVAIWGRHADQSLVAMSTWVVSLHLWFVPVYLVMMCLTPLAVAAHRRWGLWVPASLAVATAGVDVVTRGDHLAALGMANYVICWGAIFQLGIAWHGGALRRPLLLAAGAVAVLASLIGLHVYPVSMIGVTGQTVQNTSPPTVALLALACTQAGLMVAAAPVMTNRLRRAPWPHLLRAANDNVMSLYLWHMAPVVAVALACYPTGLLPQAALGTDFWWQLRLVWIVMLGVTTAAELTLLWLGRSVFAQPLPALRVPLPTSWSGPLLLVGTAAAALSLLRISAHGFAPGGHPSTSTVAVFTVGIVLVAVHPTGGRHGRVVHGTSKSAPLEGTSP